MVKVVTPAVNPDTEPMFVVPIYGDEHVKVKRHSITGHEGPETE
jgi:hypothetical protein